MMSRPRWRARTVFPLASPSVLTIRFPAMETGTSFLSGFFLAHLKRKFCG